MEIEPRKVQIEPEIQQAIDLLKWQLGVFAANYFIEFYPLDDKPDEYAYDIFSTTLNEDK